MEEVDRVVEGRGEEGGGRNVNSNEQRDEKEEEVLIAVAGN